jgi:UDP:flavonoid glycosyltransferase YjiC (YdhE family)
MEGHVRPLLPVAHALAGAGHDVRVATGAGFHERVRQAGLVPVLAGSAFEPAFALSERDPRFAEFPLLNERQQPSA